MTSLAHMKFHIVRNTAPWEEQFEDATKLASSRCEVIALTHTPRNLGQMNVQILWYLPSTASYSFKIKHITNEFANWDTLLEDTVKYLNTYIAPHQLLALSIFEDDHPCDNDLYHSVVAHKGSDATPLVKGEDIKGDIYKLKIYRQNSTWEDILHRVTLDMEHIGTEQNKFLIATSNNTENDSQVLALVYWSKTHEDALTDISRGGCSCTIF